MKKAILLSAMFLVCSLISAQAQINKGDWLFGGTFGYNASNANSTNFYTNTNVNVIPNFGYAIGNNSVIGLNLGINYSKAANSTTDFSLATNFFYKKYFTLKDKLGAYLQFNGGVGWYTSTYYASDSTGAILAKSTSRTIIYNVGIVPGIYYKITPRIFLTADCGGLTYNYNKYTNRDWSSGLSLNLLNNFTMGVNFLLRKG